MNIKKQTIKNTTFSYLGVSIGFITQVFLVPNFLTKEQNGLLGVLLAYMYILVQIGSLGFNSAGTKFFPKFKQDTQTQNGYLYIGLLISCAGFVIISLIFWGFQTIELHFFSLKISEKSTTSSYLQTYGFFVFPLTFGTILFNLFDNYAKNNFDTTSGTFLSQTFQRFCQFLAIGIYALGWVKYETFMWIWLCAILCYLIPMVIQIRKIKGFSWKKNTYFFYSDFKNDFFQYSAFSVLGGFSTMIVQYIDKIMLKNSISLADVGVYTTSIYFISVMGMALVAVNKASAPVISNAFENKDFAVIQKIYQKSCLTQLILGFFIYGIIILNFDSVFGLLRDKSYLAGKWVVIIFGAGKLFDLATGANGLILSLSKYYKYDTYTMISLVVLVIGLNFLFIPAYGIIGAAIVAMIATVYFNTVRFWLVWKKLGFQPFDRKILILILIGIGSLGVYFIHFSQNPFLSMLFKSLTFFSIYIPLVYFSNLSEEINGYMRLILNKINVSKF